MNDNKYISTKHLDAILYPEGGVKLVINKVTKSPYGWTKRDLLSAPFGVKTKEFTYEYVSNKVDEVYSTFPNEEIDDLLNKIKLYKNEEVN